MGLDHGSISESWKWVIIEIGKTAFCKFKGILNQNISYGAFGTPNYPELVISLLLIGHI